MKALCPAERIGILVQALFFLLGSIFVSSVVAEGSEEVLGEPESLSSHPTCILYLGTQGEEDVLVVEKEPPSLTIYRGNSGGIRKILSVPCSVGKKGDKFKDGDGRTPEGIYRLVEFLPGSRLPVEYGDGAYVLDYPNFFDRLRGKGGKGIWLHGTHLPGRVTEPYDTKGCIVVKNSDLRLLSRYIIPLRTYIIVQRKRSFISHNQWTKEAYSILEFIQTWRRSWEGRGSVSISGLYSKAFRTQGYDWWGWMSYRRTFNRLYRRVRLVIRDLRAFRHGNRGVAVFHQELWADGALSSGIKYLYLVREKGSWRIVGEELTESPFLRPGHRIRVHPLAMGRTPLPRGVYRKWRE